jgi:hypothetical protein
MGRRKIEIEEIANERVRRVTFKKRRIGLLKKAIQLSKLTNAQVILKIYDPEDKTLIEYISNENDDINTISQSSPLVGEYT